MKAKHILLPAAGALALAWPAAAQRKLEVVTTLPTYAAIAREITGDLANVSAIARGDENPHFVNPRPSFAARLQRADLFVTTGLDLELWVPALLDRANNPRVQPGAPGNVPAYAGVRLLDVPENVSRAGGDIHVYGNPHIHTDPANAVVIARNINEGLKRVDGANGATYDRNLAAFERRIAERLFGPEFVGMIGLEPLLDLATTGQFWPFVEGRSVGGKPLADYLGGWLGAGKPFRDRQVVCYHKNWAYFSARFRLSCAMFIEAKPGIPPSPGHVQDVIAFIRSEHITVLWASNYFSRAQIDRVADRAGATPVIVTEHVGGLEGVDDYFALVDHWVTSLSEQFKR
jgi:zinc/manganese transport system substrate-binding protein